MSYVFAMMKPFGLFGDDKLNTRASHVQSFKNTPITIYVINKQFDHLYLMATCHSISMFGTTIRIHNN